MYENPQGSSQSLGCFVDTSNRVLPVRGNGNSVTTCIADCKSRNQAYAGMENGNECWCGGSLPSTPADNSKCSAKCSDGACGGAWVISVYSTGSSGGTSPSSTTTPTTTPTQPANSNPSTPVSANAAAVAVIGAANPPSAGGAKAVYAHQMVGNVGISCHRAT